jgi:iron complex outermembrane receptor protein
LISVANIPPTNNPKEATENLNLASVCGVQFSCGDIEQISELTFDATRFAIPKRFNHPREDIVRACLECLRRCLPDKLLQTPVTLKSSKENKSWLSEIVRQFNERDRTKVFFRPSESLFLGLSVARNERAPSEVELFAEGAHIATGAFEVGDIDLESEVATSVEATVHLDSGPFEFDLHAYHAGYDGFIDLTPTGLDDPDSELPVFAYVQTDATFRGFEAEARYRVWEDSGRTLSLSAAADHVRASTDLGPAARIPPWSATIGLDWTSRLYDLGVEVRHVGEQDRTAAFELPTDSYTLVNLKGALRPFADRNVILFAEAANLGDEEAREHASFQKDIAPQPGRSLRVGVTYRF